MSVPRMRFGYNSSSDSKLLREAKSIKDRMADNPKFTTIQDDYTVFVARYTDFEESILPRNVRDPELTEKKNKNKKALLVVMRSLGYTIMALAKDDPEIILSSGFELVASRESKKVPDTPLNVEAFITNLSGAIIAKCKRDKNTRIYKARVSEDQINWKWTGDNSARNVLVEGLPLGKIFYVQMAQKNNLGQSGWSKATSVRLPGKDEPESKKVSVKRIK